MPLTPELIVLLVQAGIRYGAPAVIAIIGFIKKATSGEPLTDADITAAFAPCHTPLAEGLLPGVLIPDAPAPGTTTTTTVTTPPAPPP